jgi:hypothetical protein
MIGKSGVLYQKKGMKNAEWFFTTKDTKGTQDLTAKGAESVKVFWKMKTRFFLRVKLILFRWALF